MTKGFLSRWHRWSEKKTVNQNQKVWIQKLHEGISIPTILIICIALVLWTVYGILVDSFAIIVANTTAGACVLSVAIRVIQLRRNGK